MSKNKNIVFARPPFAKETFTDEAQKKFNELPGWQRHLVKQILSHGDLVRAAQESGVSRYVKENIDFNAAETRTVLDGLKHQGLTTEKIAAHLIDCLEANVTKFDQRGHLITMVDHRIKLKALELILTLRGELSKAKPTATNAGVVDLFPDIETT